MTLLIITILTTLNTGDITHNDINYMILLVNDLLTTVNKKHIYNIAFIYVMNKVIICKVFVSFVEVSSKTQ